MKFICYILLDLELFTGKKEEKIKDKINFMFYIWIKTKDVLLVTVEDIEEV